MRLCFIAGLIFCWLCCTANKAAAIDVSSWAEIQANIGTDRTLTLVNDVTATGSSALGTYSGLVFQGQMTGSGSYTVLTGNTIANLFAVSSGSPLTTQMIIQNLVVSGYNNYKAGGVINNGTNSPIGSISNVTFLNNRSSGNGGVISNNTQTVADGIEIDALFNGNYSGNSGGAIYNTGVINSLDGEFISNSSAKQGGALYNAALATSDVGDISASFQENTALFGGAIYNGGNATITSITDSDFSDNTATSGSQLQGGGAIYNLGEIGTISNTTFTQNIQSNTARANARGGGAIYNGGTITEILDATFTDNLARATENSNNDNNSGGGAIFNSGNIGTITGTFDGNMTYGLSYNGGGALYNSSSGTITTIGDVANPSATVFENSFGASGGAIRNLGTITTLAADFTNNGYQNLNISLNSSSTSGGAVHNAGKIMTLSGTFSGNKARLKGGAIFSGPKKTADGPGTVIINVANAVFDANMIAASNAENTDRGGGAIWNNGNLTITNSTFTNNVVELVSSGGGGSLGGAIYTRQNISVTDSSFSDNRDGSGPNDIYLGEGADLTFTVTATGCGSGSCSLASGLRSQNNSSILTKEGVGTLVLAAGSLNINQFLGPIVINGGTLAYANTETGASLTDRSIQIAAGSVFAYNATKAGGAITLTNITGAGGFTKSGSQTVILNNASNSSNYLSGNLRVLSGALITDSGYYTGNNVFLRSTLDNSGNPLSSVFQFNLLANTSLTGFTLGGDEDTVFAKTGIYDLTFNGGADMSSFDGVLSVEAGNVNWNATTDTDTYISGTTSLFAGTELNINTGTFSTEGGSLSSNSMGSGELNKTGAGTLIMSGDNSSFTGAVNIIQGSLEFDLNNPADDVFFGGGVYVNGGANLTVNVANDVTGSVAQSLQGYDDGTGVTYGSFIKTNTGILNLSGDQRNFDGDVYVNAGTLNYTASADNYFFEGALTVNTGAILNLTEGAGLSRQLQSTFLGGGTINKYGAGTLIMGGNNIDYSGFDGLFNVGGGTVTFNKLSASDVFVDGDINIADGAILNMNIGSSLASNLDFLRVEDGGVLNKNGAGNLYLYADDTTLGTINANGGLTQMTDTTSATNFTVNVDNDATFKYISAQDMHLADISGDFTFAATSNNAALILSAATPVSSPVLKYYLDARLLSAASQNNTVGFENSIVQFVSTINNFDYGTHTFANSIIDTTGDNLATTYSFSQINILDNLTKVKLDVNLSADTLAADKLVNSAIGGRSPETIILGGLVLNNVDSGLTGTEQITVLEGLQFDTTGGVDIAWSTNVYEYAVNIALNAADASLGYTDLMFQKTGPASEDSLRVINQTSGLRGFNFEFIPDNTTYTYNVFRDLDTTAVGNITLQGRLDTTGSNILAIVSGNTVNCALCIPSIPTEANASFFELTNATELTIRNVIIQDAVRYSLDTITQGSVVYANNALASLTLDNVTLKDNTAAGDGGAVAILNTGNSVGIDESEFNNNISGANGGAIYTAESMTLDNSLFEGNSATSAGGAIYTAATQEVTDTSFTNNSAGTNGGAIYSSANLTIENSSFANNSAGGVANIFIWRTVRI